MVWPFLFVVVRAVVLKRDRIEDRKADWRIARTKYERELHHTGRDLEAVLGVGRGGDICCWS